MNRMLSTHWHTHNYIQNALLHSTWGELSWNAILSNTDNVKCNTNTNRNLFAVGTEAKILCWNPIPAFSVKGSMHFWVFDYTVLLIHCRTFFFRVVVYLMVIQIWWAELKHSVYFNCTYRYISVGKHSLLPSVSFITKTIDIVLKRSTFYTVLTICTRTCTLSVLLFFIESETMMRNRGRETLRLQNRVNNKVTDICAFLWDYALHFGPFFVIVAQNAFSVFFWHSDYFAKFWLSGFQYNMRVSALFPYAVQIKWIIAFDAIVVFQFYYFIHVCICAPCVHVLETTVHGS